jgi:hypothetical protein
LIANIRYAGNTVDQWFISNLKIAGTYNQTEGYGSTQINSAQFIPGVSYQVDTSYSVSHVTWRPARDNAPLCDPFFWPASTQNPHQPGACYRTDTQVFDSNILPQRFSLVYQLAVTAYPPLTLSLNDWEANDSNYRLFGVFVTSASPPVQSYAWEYSTNGVVWSTLPSSCGYTNQYRGAYRSDPPQTPPVYLRATVTLINGQTKTQNANWSPAPINISDTFCN